MLLYWVFYFCLNTLVPTRKTKLLTSQLKTLRQVICNLFKTSPLSKTGWRGGAGVQVGMGQLVQQWFWNEARGLWPQGGGAGAESDPDRRGDRKQQQPWGTGGWGIRKGLGGCRDSTGLRVLGLYVALGT